MRDQICQTFAGQIGAMAIDVAWIKNIETEDKIALVSHICI
jgi:hypothetical protein